MPGATATLALPYPVAADPVAVPADMLALATRLDGLGGGIAPFTTAARDALAGSNRWTGRHISNTTTGRIERWDGAAWVPAAALDLQGTLAARPAAGVQGRYYYATDNGRLYRDTGAAWTQINGVTFRVGWAYELPGDIKVAVGQTDFLPVVPIPLPPAGQTITLIGYQWALQFGTSFTFRIDHADYGAGTNLVTGVVGGNGSSDVNSFATPKVITNASVGGQRWIPQVTAISGAPASGAIVMVADITV